MRNMTAQEIMNKGKKMTVKATAYTSCPSEGGAYSYSGKRLKIGMIAADLKVLPIGTKVYIPHFNKWYTVEDTGRAIKGNKIDIFMNSKWECKQWGIKTIEIYVFE